MYTLGYFNVNGLVIIDGSVAKTLQCLNGNMKNKLGTSDGFH